MLSNWVSIFKVSVYKQIHTHTQVYIGLENFKKKKKTTTVILVITEEWDLKDQWE